VLFVAVYSDFVESAVLVVAVSLVAVADLFVVAALSLALSPPVVFAFVIAAAAIVIGTFSLLLFLAAFAF